MVHAHLLMRPIQVLNSTETPSASLSLVVLATALQVMPVTLLRCLPEDSGSAVLTQERSSEAHAKQTSAFQTAEP
jgi:hypothetical protein